MACIINRNYNDGLESFPDKSLFEISMFLTLGYIKQNVLALSKENMVDLYVPFELTFLTSVFFYLRINEIIGVL